MALTYELLLDLYRGRSTAVEQIQDQKQLEAIAVDTPVGQLLRAFDKANAPRHVVLTGSAGDGKTFAAVTAGTSTFQVITDASARRPGIDLAPIDDLAAQIGEVLRAGRLLLAINRGQLERLYERTVARGGPVAQFVAEVRAKTLLRDQWGPPDTSVAVVDLGHLERTSAARAMIAKVGDLPDAPHLAAPTRAAFAQARAAFKDPRVVEWVLSVVRAATASGLNVSMRQLWSFVSLLATGARRPDDETPTSLEDAVGARLFAASAEGTLFEVARERCDPVLTPNARLARRIVDGSMLADMRASDQVGALAAGAPAGGRTLTRVAVVHGIGVAIAPTQLRDTYSEVVNDLMKLPPGPQRLGVYPRNVLRGVYKALGLWHSAETLPGWQTLCFDSSRLRLAAAVADSHLNQAEFRLSLPRPPPEVSEFLLSSWRPPFVWLAAPGQPALRLAPRAFSALLTSGASAIEPEDSFALDSWLRRISRAPGVAVTRDDPAKLRINRRGSGDCVVLEEALQGKTAVSVE